MRLRSLFISIRRVCSHLKHQTRENKYKNAAFCTDTLRFHLTKWLVRFRNLAFSQNQLIAKCYRRH